jgi:mercuric ion binding protein
MSIKTLLLVVSLLSGLFAMPTSYAESSGQVQNNSQTLVFNVQNMTCSMCKYTIKKALSSVAGTEKISINFEDKTATVTFDPKKTNSNALTKAIANAGYPATVQATKK